MNIGGRLNQIESGPNGVTWGVNRASKIFYRAGVNRRRPIGSHWVLIKGRLKSVSPGCTGIYGVNKKGQVWLYSGKDHTGFYLK